MNQAQALVLKATDSNATLAEQHEAFCELVRIFQDMAYACAYAVLGDFYLAEDAAQEAFISAWQKISQLRQPEAFPGWFRRIVLTECNRLRRGKRLRTMSLDEGVNLHAPQTDPQTAIERDELTKVMFTAIKKLSLNERMVVVLFYVKEHSQSDISTFLDVPLTTVAKRLYSARVRLRGMMMERFKNDLTARRPSRNEEFARRVMALLNAAAVGDASEVERLLVQSQGQSSKLVNASGPHPYWGGEPTALHVAAEWGRAEVVELLLKQGADPNVRGAEYDHWSPLHVAIHRDHGPASHDRVIELLIVHGAEVDIWAAAALGDAERVRKLLAGDSSLVRAEGPNDATPLHFAATVEVAQLLVAAGADLMAKDKYGRSPLQAVAGYGQRRRAAALYLSEQTGELDIFIACAIGEAEAVASFLVAQPELIHAHSEAGWLGETPLNVAARHGQTEVVRTLLRLGADANLKAPSGCFPLHLAARNGHIETARLLLDHGADLNAREDQHQSTPLGWAEFQGQQEMDRFLRQRGGILARDLVS